MNAAQLLLITAFISYSTVSGVSAQSFSDIRPSPEPLVLAGQGSFFVGGRTVRTEAAGWSSMRDVFGDAYEVGDVVVDQMYVQFQTPSDPAHTPIVFMHGGVLSSKQWETTPDGRMGWYEYFTRQGFPTYLAEQTGRARSGFDARMFNRVREGSVPPEDQASVLQATSEMAWNVFRFGPELGEQRPDTQFPIDHVDELLKQAIPDLIETQVPSLLAELTSPTTENPTVDNVAQLAKDLGGAILVGHSQSAGFPTQAALKRVGGIRGMVQLETGCFTNLTEDQVAVLAAIPMLIIVGDHLGDQPEQACMKQIEQITGAGGDITYLSLPDAGLLGNSHMFMQDRNNLQVADLIIEWVNFHVDHR